MNKKVESKKCRFAGLAYILIVTLLFLMSAPAASAHGPKEHGDSEFTALRAAKKSLVFYDRLVSFKKIPESWETDLVSIEIIQRTNKHKNEYVVKFSRSSGDPRSVYIFLNEKGEYSGSNFTGK
ncbi:MAG: hypothetical protein BMS9Abin03_225 [Thermodesulfobacteriota bacterium]|nr:MAG: hypothetical protein BMS9Abin03_225 [Thermodesulfobacteriota bacterium]